MDAMKPFSARLKALRKEKGLSQAELAKELGVSRGATSFYENGDRVPDIAFLRRACKFFDVSADYLIGLSDSKQAEFHRFTEQTGFDFATVEKLLTYSRGGWPGHWGNNPYQLSFEMFLNSIFFDDLLENLRDYIRSNFAKEKVDNFEDMLIYFDEKIRDVSKEGLQVLPSAMASTVFLYKAQENIVKIFEGILRDKDKVERMYMASHPNATKGENDNG